MRFVRIIKIPSGEAPAKIRAAWVGVILPLANISGPQPSLWETMGVLGKEHGLSGRLKRFFGISTGYQPCVAYVVDVLAAIEVLRVHAPLAAVWWERHTPHLLKQDSKFLFEVSCCEEVAGELT